MVKKRPGRKPLPPEWARNDTPLWGNVAEAWWKWAWDQPISGLWETADHPALCRRALMEQVFTMAPQAALAAQMLSLDDRLGLTPTSRMRMRVKYEDEAEAKPSSTTGKAKGNVIRLHA